MPNSSSSDVPPFRGGWVGWTAYEAAAWSEPTAIRPNPNQLGLAFGLYLDTVAFDHVRKVVHLQHVAQCDESDAGAQAALDAIESDIRRQAASIPGGRVPSELGRRPEICEAGVFPREDFETAVETAQEYISAGDAFQIVLSRAVELQTDVDPFEITERRMQSKPLHGVLARRGRDARRRKSRDPLPSPWPPRGQSPLGRDAEGVQRNKTSATSKNSEVTPRRTQARHAR